MRSPEPDLPEVVARPPLVFVSSMALGFILQRLWPLGVLPGSFGVTVGAALVALSVILFVLAVRQFRRAGTGIPTNRPTTAIVRSGPYRFSRNPIYLSFTLLQLGLAAWANSAWLLVTLIPTLAVIRYGVISREEAYLERKFGQEYREYRRAVRRWL